MKRRPFSLEASCLKLGSRGSWKSKHQNVLSFMFAISSWTYGGAGGLAACLEWSICYTRDAAVPGSPGPRHTNPAQRTHNRVSWLRAPSSLLHRATALTSGWLHTASWKWGLSRLTFDERVVWDANASPSCLSWGLWYWYSPPKHWSTLYKQELVNV